MHGPCFEKLRKCLGGDRLAENIALGEFASILAQAFKLFCGFRPLRNHSQSQSMGHENSCVDQFPICWIDSKESSKYKFPVLRRNVVCLQGAAKGA